MVPNKSLDEVIKIISTLLCDVHSTHGIVFNTKSLKNTLNQVNKRALTEGIGFITKTMPRLAKAFDKALAGTTPLNCTSLALARAHKGSNLPRFLGEFFSRVLRPDGTLLESPCVTSVMVIRQVLYCFYKYSLLYSDEQEQEVISRFEKTEEDLSTTDKLLKELRDALPLCIINRRRPNKQPKTQLDVVREARILLAELFAYFDPRSIHPRHGPGAVATRQRSHEKYTWTNISAKLTDLYPFDAFFCASLGHVCDEFDKYKFIDDKDLPARVVLVPKDSRGPRLISCEPVDFQWIQQGLGKAITDLVEGHPLTRDNVRFTDQEPNRIAAKYGSESGRYSTLDLNEASDRVSLELVRLLFPEHIVVFLEGCRTSSTELPNGRVLPLRKFAPMGSCLCFPILALTTWAILAAAAPDADARESIYVYGDDVIVPRDYTLNAIEQLESFGLKVNRDKSCTGGLFRESCGMDAFKGVDVTPVKLKTVWSSSPSPDVYTSWIAYANSFYDRRYFRTYDLIVGWLQSVYGSIPGEELDIPAPSLRETPDTQRPLRSRMNKRLQKREYNTWDVEAPVHRKVLPGWQMLFRFFAETTNDTPFGGRSDREYKQESPLMVKPAFSVSQYTNRYTSRLVRRWR